MSRPPLQFWFDFGSTYSYPAALRIEQAARAEGVELRWKPFLLGPIFRQQGWSDSPYNLNPLRGLPVQLCRGPGYIRPGRDRRDPRPAG